MGYLGIATCFTAGVHSKRVFGSPVDFLHQRLVDMLLGHILPLLGVQPLPSDSFHFLFQPDCRILGTCFGMRVSHGSRSEIGAYSRFAGTLSIIHVSGGQIPQTF